MERYEAGKAIRDEWVKQGQEAKQNRVNEIKKIEEELIVEEGILAGLEEEREREEEEENKQKEEKRDQLTEQFKEALKVIFRERIGEGEKKKKKKKYLSFLFLHLSFFFSFSFSFSPPLPLLFI